MPGLCKSTLVVQVSRSPDHLEPHLNTVLGVQLVRDGLAVLVQAGQAGHAVVTVAQDLDPQALVSLEVGGGEGG